ncbi:MAG: restriction endonuclease subunit S [Alphaproteobacteria bacterium]|nr:MAG: restriction endonuclease subunit S [Alphaproteobacteria bacterium]
MSTRIGYKQTDFGVIPSDWDYVPIGELFAFKNGLNKAKKFFGYGTPIVNYMDVYGQPSLRIEQVTGRVDVSSKELNAYSVRKGDVFFTRTSETVEEIGVASVMLDDAENTVYSGFVLRARPTNDSLSDAFKVYCFSPRYFRQQIAARASYTTRALTNGRSLSAALLARPPFPEQRAIATVLSDMDALLMGLTRLIKKKRDLKQAAMQQLLTGQTRLPGFQGEWETKQLGDICEISMGRTPPRLNQAFWGRGYTWLSIADLKSKVVSESKEQITALAASMMTIIPKGTLLMSFKLSIGRLCFAGRDLFTNEAICGFNKLQANPEFLYYALSRTDFSLYGKQAVKGYTLNKESLKIVEVRLPSLEEQVAIGAVLSDMDAELSALEARRDKTRALKQAMMQELLTGKTRLLDVEGRTS